MNYVAYLVLRRLRAPLIALIVVWSLAVLGYVLIPGVDGNGNPYRMDFLHAFYFVSYMGSTIGFGEIPYAFTPLQRYWTLFCIYATVVCWFYSIGAVVTTFRDPNFLNLVRRTRFHYRVLKMREPFYLVCGYGTTGSALVTDLALHGVQMVVVDIDSIRIDALELDNHPFDIPRLCADAGDPEVLQDAGVQHAMCRGVLCLTNNDQVNLYVAIASKLLAPERVVISRVSSRETAANMVSFGTDYVIDPFETFADYLTQAILLPFHQMVYHWLISPHHRPIETARKAWHGRWIICGYGRLGRALQLRLEANGLPSVVIDPNPTEREHEECRIVEGRGTEAVTLLEADIRHAVGIVAGTPDDASNLSILMTARELNPGVVTVARQNRPTNDPLFRAARVDFTMDPSLIIAQRMSALIKTPMLIEFLEGLNRQTEDWCENLLKSFNEMVHENRLESWSVRLSKQETPAVYECLRHGDAVTLQTLLAHPLERDVQLRALPLLLQRGDEQHFMPAQEQLLRIDDRILFAGQVRAQSSMAWTLNNENVLRYVVTGHEGASGLLWKRFLRQSQGERSGG